MTSNLNHVYRNGRLTRRRLLAGGGALLVTTSVAGCDLSTDPAGEEENGDDTPDEPAAKEAPELAERVANGDLPPLEERLPENPLVVQPLDQAGVYGGEWNTAVQGAGDASWLYMTTGYEHLVCWDPDYKQVVPNVAEAVEPSSDGRSYTFKLRRGMRWSDGEPYTADDIVFTYEDVLRNQELRPALPAYLASNGEPATLERIDDYTVRFTFAEPNGIFLERLATPAGQLLTCWPRHYLEQFHKDYNPDIDALVESEGYEDWVALFDGKGSLAGRLGAQYWSNPDIPTLSAWHVTQPLGEGARAVLERNPYYWKVDPDGRQLPYINKVAFNVVEDQEVLVLQASNGEIDLDTLHVNVPENKPILAENSEQNDYRLLELKDAGMNLMIISFNLTHRNETLRQVFNNKDFRIGLSHAINREEIVDAAFQRQGEPWQAAPRRDSDFFDEEMAKQYIEYSVDLANEHLDRAGYTERDDAGFRLGPDGERISFAVDVTVPDRTGRAAALEMIPAYWEAVGIEMRLNSIDRALYTERKRANEHDATVWGGAGGSTQEAMLSPTYYFPSGGGSDYAIPWAHWYSGGPEPMEEPPEAPMRQMELYDQLQQTVNVDERLDLFRQILEIAKEEFYVIGTAIVPDGVMFGVIKNDFHNVLEPMFWSWQYPPPGPTRPEQYFISSDA